MISSNAEYLNSVLEKIQADADGSPIGVTRIDPNKSYSGIGYLLQEVINNTDYAAWQKIKEKIDYTYECLDLSLYPLMKKTNFHDSIFSRLQKGQKLLFKPNIVNPICINPQSHDLGMGSTACTEWAFVAALMRWFHEKLKIKYHQMAIGEASTMTTSVAGLFSMMNPAGKKITPEAVIEGKSGDFYGGWGFYFARKYLAESSVDSEGENSMNGFEESVEGTYIPMGLASDKLMVYDLNRIYGNEDRGMVIKVSDGINFKHIMMHKAVVGGNKADPADSLSNPGCILINVPKFKVHAISLFTNIIKNLGIGLYPMQYAGSGDCNWDYSCPSRSITGMKGRLPHEIWVPEIESDTGLPQRDENGIYVVKKTGGLNATMIDVIKAVQEQDIFMLHIVDGIEAINIDHQGIGLGKKVPEGMIFAALDPVAADLLCARYMFSNVSLKEALEINVGKKEDEYFPQVVPVPALEGTNIVSKPGYDNPISRESLFKKAEARGLGNRKYFGIGTDAITGQKLMTVKGHLGRNENGKFSDLITETIFYDSFKFPWDMQKTTFAYLECSDKLAGTSIKKEFLDAVDSSNSGILEYSNFGKKGIWGTILYFAGDMVSQMGSDRIGYLKGRYSVYARMLKNSNSKFNKEEHDLLKEYFYGGACSAAFMISQLEMELPDPFQPGLLCGKGKWPSFQLAQFFQMGVILYGEGYPYMVGYPSMYVSALLYADITQNGGQYAGKVWGKPDLEAINQYVEKAGGDGVAPLQFTVYMPAGYDNLSGKIIPNVEITSDPQKILTAQFANGKEVWPESKL